MAYKILDKQIPGRQFADGTIFKTREAVREQLIDYHSIDFEDDGVSDLKTLNSFSLVDVLEYGDWDIVEVDRKGRYVN